MIKRILAGAVLLGVYALLFHGVPPDFLAEWVMWLSVGGALLFTIALAVLTSESEAYANRAKSPKEIDWFWPKVVLFIIAFFGFAIALIWTEEHRTHKELLEYGVFTQARIVDGQSGQTARKKGASNLVITFFTEDKNTVRAKVFVDEDEFDQAYVNKVVPIVYSARYPTIAKIFSTPDEQEYFRSMGSP